MKVKFIETQFISSDAASFKAVVQRLTGNGKSPAASSRPAQAPLAPQPQRPRPCRPAFGGAVQQHQQHQATGGRSSTRLAPTWSLRRRSRCRSRRRRQPWRRCTSSATSRTCSTPPARPRARGATLLAAPSLTEFVLPSTNACSLPLQIRSLSSTLLMVEELDATRDGHGLPRLFF